MKIRTEVITLPAFLATGLFYGDTSGWTDEDIAWLDAAHKYIAPARVSDCSEESFFSNYCSLPNWRLGADMLEYTIYYTEES